MKSWLLTCCCPKEVSPVRSLDTWMVWARGLLRLLGPLPWTALSQEASSGTPPGAQRPSVVSLCQHSGTQL